MLTFRHPQNNKDTEEIYRMRYNIYCLEKKYIPLEDCPNGLEQDKFDHYSTHFIAFDPSVSRDTLGYFRLIQNNSYGFPLENQFAISPSPCPEQTVEISRLIISPRIRGNLEKYILDISKTIYLHCKSNNIRYCYAVIEEPLLMSLQRSGVPFQVVDEGRWYMNGFTLPVILDLTKAEKDAKKNNPKFYKLVENIGSLGSHGIDDEEEKP